MKTFTIILGALFAASALAGCADNDDGEQPTPATGVTPTSATPTNPTTPTTPTVDGEMGGPDPRCMGPATNAPAGLANVTGNATRLGMPELSFTTSDATDADPCFRFHGPKSAESGWNVFTLTYPQGGRTFHIMPMYFIGDHTMQDVMEAFASESEPEWATPSGAVGGVTPGQSGSVAIDLQPGNYMYFCPIEGHMMKGMMGMLTVTPSQNESAAPEADATITLEDYNFTIPELTEDMTVVRVTNNGSEPHEAPLVRLNDGANLTAFIHAVEDPNATGPPPGVLIGGVNGIAPGQTVYLLLELDHDATYGMMCFVSSAAHGGAPHIEIGPMLREFEVEHGEEG